MMSRSLPMNGRAMLAIVASSTTISWATVISTRARPRRTGRPVSGCTATASLGPSPTTVSSDMGCSSVSLGVWVGQRGGQDDLVDDARDGLLVGRQPHQEQAVQHDPGEGRGQEVEVDPLAEL